MDNEDKCVICITCPVTFSVFFPLCLLCYPLSFCLEKICGEPETDENNISKYINGEQNQTQSKRLEFSIEGNV